MSLTLILLFGQMENEERCLTWLDGFDCDTSLFQKRCFTTLVSLSSCLSIDQLIDRELIENFAHPRPRLLQVTTVRCVCGTWTVRRASRRSRPTGRRARRPSTTWPSTPPRPTSPPPVQMPSPGSTCSPPAGDAHRWTDGLTVGKTGRWTERGWSLHTFDSIQVCLGF